MAGDGRDWQCCLRDRDSVGRYYGRLPTMRRISEMASSIITCARLTPTSGCVGIPRTAIGKGFAIVVRPAALSLFASYIYAKPVIEPQRRIFRSS